MSEKFVKLNTDLLEPPGALFLHHLLGQGGNEFLPVGQAHLGGGCEGHLLDLEGLQGEDGTPEVALAGLSNVVGQLGGDGKALLLGNGLKHTHDLLLARGRNTDGKAPATNRLEDLGVAVAAEDEAEGRDVLLHGTTEGVLGITRELVNLIEDDDLEGPLVRGVNGGRLGDLFDDLLHHEAVLGPHVGGVHLDVVP